MMTILRTPITAALCIAMLAACSDKNAAPDASLSEKQLQTDVIGMEERFLTPSFWIEKTTDRDELVLSARQIDALNKNSFATDETMVELSDYPDELSADKLTTAIRAISRVPDTPRYYADGKLLTEGNYARYEASLNLQAIADNNPVEFGLVVQRANMRSYPTDDAIYKAPTPDDLDRFQENGLFPADVVAVLHTSSDGEWRLVQSFNYLAWVRAAAVAIGDRQTILDYSKRPDFVVVTGSKAFTNFNPEQPALSELQLDMGVRLPLATREAIGDNLYGQNPYASYAIVLPVRDESGRLQLRPALVARSQDITVGYLPYTRENLISQAFKFLGERYGWGHSYNARDCTGFVSEIYKTFGVFLPRNSGDQGRSDIGVNIRFDETALADTKIKALQKLQVGDLIYIPGHVMIYLGEIDGNPYVIQDVSGLAYNTEAGEFYSGVLSGVAITPLLPLRATEDRSYVDSITSIKKIN